MKLAWLFCFLITIPALTGCESVSFGSRSTGQDRYESVDKGGPPPWAPAHGYRNKMQYRYYPAQQVYFNLDRGQYIWLEHGAWRVASRLPKYIRLGKSVTVEIEGDQPHLYHRQIVQAYPPGHVKKIKNKPRKIKTEKPGKNPGKSGR